MLFDQIPKDTFETLTLGAGMVFSKFTVEPGPDAQNYAEEDILGATSGGTNFSAVPSFIDRGEGIDNCPKNMMELMDIDTIDVKASGTLTTITAKLAAKLAAAADLGGNKVTPRKHLQAKDFGDFWLVAPYGKEGNGMVAIHIMNALSTGGFQIQTADKDKGKMSFEFTGHYSMAHQDTVPYEVFVEAGSPAAAAVAAGGKK